MPTQELTEKEKREYLEIAKKDGTPVFIIDHEKLKVGIIGASGYTGHELIKILSKISSVKILVLNSRSLAGKKVSAEYPDFSRDLKYTDFTLDEINQMKLDVLFTATPNGEAMNIVPKVNCKVIDLSADYRFSDKSIYEQVYKIRHTDKERKAVYGLPEIFKNEIKKAKVIANPGCYATASILAAYPIQEFSDYIVFDCKSGYSGAGKKQSYANEPKNFTDNIIPYNLTNHRHKFEIEQFIKAKLSFTPHVIATFQGLMSTAHIILKKKITKEEVKKIYQKFYSGKPFVKILDKIPDLHDVQKTNYCCIGGFEIDSNNQLVIISVIDNLIKGASGQAVQSMNIMFGVDETKGLL